MNALPVSFFSAGSGIGKAEFHRDMAATLTKPTATQPSDASFNAVMGNLVNAINDTAQKPDLMMHDALVTGNVDVHDLMVANAKAELAVTVTTQVATKVVQAWDKITQIQL
ncbi:MAG: flagellar hook-basal body complex protein FliE [Cyanobacteria bacterium P01_H01_bin.74]